MVNAPRHALRVFLAQRGKSQGWLAQEMRRSQCLISQVLGGWRRPTPDFIRRFRRVTRIDLNQYPRTPTGYLTGKPPVPDAVPDAETAPQLVQTS